MSTFAPLSIQPYWRKMHLATIRVIYLIINDDLSRMLFAFGINSGVEGNLLPTAVRMLPELFPLSRALYGAYPDSVALGIVVKLA